MFMTRTSLNVPDSPFDLHPQNSVNVRCRILRTLKIPEYWSKLECGSRNASLVHWHKPIVICLDGNFRVIGSEN
jgi:hypothetical protein